VELYGGQARGHCDEFFGREGLGTFDGQSKSTDPVSNLFHALGRGGVPIPDELRQDTESAGYAKEDGVKVHFYEAVVMQQDTRVGVDVGVRVLDFAEFVEDAGGESVHLRDEFEQFVVGEVFQCKLPRSSATIEKGGGGGPLSHVSRIGLSEDGMAVSGDDTTTLQSRPNVFFDRIIRDIHTNSILHLHNPSQDFLIGESVKWACKTIQPSSQRQHGTR
jgi:hypothetical protein